MEEIGTMEIEHQKVNGTLEMQLYYSNTFVVVYLAFTLLSHYLVDPACKTCLGSHMGTMSIKNEMRKCSRPEGTKKLPGLNLYSTAIT